MPAVQPRAKDALVLTAAAGLGIAAESYGYDWSQPLLWVPDLIVGWVFLATGWLAGRQGSRGAGALLGATGITWFLGTISVHLLFLHRGPLVHLLVAYPGWRWRSRLALLTIGVGYLSVVLPGLWDDPVVSSGLVLLVLGAVFISFLRSTGRARRQSGTALTATAVIGLVLVAATLVEALDLPRVSGTDLLLAYEGALVVAALLLWRGLRPSAATTVTDLVVELAESRSGVLRDRLARALGDPSLEVGYWSEEAQGYLDDGGRPVLSPPGADVLVAGPRPAATEVRREGRPYVLLVHDEAILAEPVLVEAVRAATRLATSNTDLQAAARSNVAELTASRRQYLVAGDRERAALESRLRRGPEHRLDELAVALATLEPADPTAAQHLMVARSQLDRTRRELIDLARGLHPRELTARGLADAVRDLGVSAPFELTVDSSVGDLPDEVAVTAWYVSAEALTNITKHARATQVRLSLGGDGGRLWLVIVDNGVGGADVSRGSGLQGLVDRVAALGGTVRLESPVGRGTRLAVELPLDRQP